MKILFFFLIAFFSFLIGHSQEKQLQIPLDKDENILNVIDLRDNGFILKIGEYLPSKSSVDHFKYYNNQGELLWEKPFSSKTSGEIKTIASPSGSNFYHIDRNGEIYNTKSHTITQINNGGDIKTFNLKGDQQYGKSLQSIFCDDQYLYYLATDNGNERHKKKKFKEILILNRFSHSDLSYKRIELQLPPLINKDETNFWSYIGQKDSEHYIMSKQHNIQSSKTQFTVIKFDIEGNIIKSFNIEIDLEDKYLRPAIDILNTEREYVVYKNFNTFYKNSGGYPEPSPTLGGFTYFQFDAENEVFYAYGLLGPKPFQKVAAVYEGFYIYQYDKEGQELWNYKHKEAKELLDEKNFRIHSTPGNRTIMLRQLANNTLGFSINFPENFTKLALFNYEFSIKDNTLISATKRSNHNVSRDGFPLDSRSMSEQFLKVKEPSDKIRYACLYKKNGEILLEQDKDASVLNIIFFNY